MKRFSEQFDTAAKRVTMTKAESRELKERLTAYMEYHPLPTEMHQSAADTARTTEQLAAEPFWMLRFNTVRTRAFASMTALLALIIVPFAAEQSVPGDTLYPVKVSFNEEIRSSLAVTPYQQVEWETKRVERRLAEARLLATEGKLTEDVETEVAAAVKSHTDAAQAGLAALRESDRDEAAIAELTFASALEVEGEVLERETERQQAAGASTTAQLAVTIANARANVAKPETTEVSFERLLARVEAETTQVTELRQSLQDEITLEEQSDIDRRLADINRKVQLALVSRDETTEVAAAELSDDPATTSVETIAEQPVDELTAKQYLREALRDTQKLIRFMTDIDVKASVSVDQLVPITPTDDERRERIRQGIRLISQQQNQLTALENPDEKLQFGLAQVAELATTVTKALEAGELTQAENAVAEALALLDDMKRSLTTTSTEVPTPPASSTIPAATSSEPVAPEATTTNATTTPETNPNSDSETDT